MGKLLGERTYTLIDGDIATALERDQYTLRFRDIASPDRPRERLMAGGPASLSFAELVAVLWGVGTRREDVLAMARRIVREYGELALQHQTDATKLAEALDIPVVKATQLIAAFELGRRAYERREGLPVFIRCAADAYSHVASIGVGRKEQLRGLYLNSRYQLIHDEVISVGSLTANIVHPREVFRPALEQGAVAVIIAHNHPSGSVKPTTEDITVTGQLRAAGKLLGIELVDHLIITEIAYQSIIKETTT